MLHWWVRRMILLLPAWLAPPLTMPLGTPWLAPPLTMPLMTPPLTMQLMMVKLQLSTQQT